ncbi:MAG: hypothetical protein K8W52_46085 [Deltaproteobacteria bacterium]|nr:hypothetical protein [Deltaproteobacteria bacterium]
MTRAVEASAEYRAIAAHYGERVARRSGVRLMQHIDEGLVILRALGADDVTQRAWCLHPLAQTPAMLDDACAALDDASDDGEVRALALAYRRTANAALSTRPLASAAEIALPGDRAIAQLLIADKVQNRKDFLRHHRATHPRGDELDRYFRLWLERLGIDEAGFARWCALLDRGDLGAS